jgi:DNA-binding response OmpR family regulator
MLGLCRNHIDLAYINVFKAVESSFLGGFEAVKHALVVEDNHLIAMMIEEELMAHGYASVETAPSQELAIELASARCPDLVTVDDKLDSGSGVDTIRAICKDQAIPVVFITAEPDAIREAVADAIIISKPFSKQQLIAAIDAAVSAPLSV